MDGSMLVRVQATQLLVPFNLIGCRANNSTPVRLLFARTSIVKE